MGVVMHANGEVLCSPGVVHDTFCSLLPLQQSGLCQPGGVWSHHLLHVDAAQGGGHRDNFPGICDAGNTVL